jgi:hypothetical protein
MRRYVSSLKPLLFQSLELMHTHYYRQHAGAAQGKPCHPFRRCCPASAAGHAPAVARRPLVTPLLRPFACQGAPPAGALLLFCLSTSLSREFQQRLCLCNDRVPAFLTAHDASLLTLPDPLDQPTGPGLCCAGGVSDRLRRITKEVSTLPGQLPLTYESGVFCAMDDDRMDVLRCVWCLLCCAVLCCDAMRCDVPAQRCVWSVLCCAVLCCGMVHGCRVCAVAWVECARCVWRGGYVAWVRGKRLVALQYTARCCCAATQPCCTLTAPWCTAAASSMLQGGHHGASRHALCSRCLCL